MVNIIDRFATYLRVERGCTENTCTSYVHDIRRFIEFINRRHKSWDSVDLNTVSSYITYLRRRGYLNSSISRTVAAIKSFYRFLVIEKHLDTSPVELLEYPKRELKLPNVLTQDEISRIVEAADSYTPLGIRDRAMLELLYSTGMRISELINLKLTDVFLDEAFLRITGKGGKERYVPIGKLAMDWLTIYLERGRPYLKQHHDSGYLFINRNGDKLTRMGVWKIVQKYAKRAGIKKPVTPHTFRHSFATHMLEGGADLRVVQELLGHASIRTTEVYTHISQEKLKEAVRLYHPRG